MVIVEVDKDSKAVKQTFIALAHRIKLNEVSWKKKYLISLVETSLFYKSDSFFNNLVDIQAFLKSENITQFEIFEHELRDAIKELEERGILININSGWKLAEHRKAELEIATNEWLNLEQKVKEDWLNNISSKYPSLKQDEKVQLWPQLIEKFVVRIFLRHGAETSKLIFRHPIPKEEEFFESCQRILELAIEELPSHLREIARNEYPLFFNPSNSARRYYLMGLLDTSLSQFAIAIPEESLRAIYNVASLEIKLFLDTNFLFSSLELMEHHLNESVKEVLKLKEAISRISGGRIKIKFYYTTETLDEFRKTIDSSISKLSGTQVSKSIAKAVVKSGKLSGIDLAYFKKLAESNVTITPEEYYKPYRDGSGRLLRKEGIEVYNRRDISLDDVRYEQEVIDDTHDFDTYLKEQEKEREWRTIEHDVRLWHYVKKLREYFLISPQVSTPLAAAFFILTLDYRFLSFDRHKFKEKNESTICLLPTQFLQMLSLFIPRTEDFEKAFILSMQTPIAKTVDVETEKVSLNILKAIAVYKDFSEDVAVGLLMDEALKGEVKGVTDPEEVRRLIEDKLSKELEEERRRYRILEQEKNTKLSEKDEQITHLTELNNRGEIKIKELEKQIEDFRKFKEESEKKEDRKYRNKRILTQIFKWVGCFVLGIILGGLSLKFWNNIPKMIQIILIFSIVWTLSLPLGLKKTWKSFLLYQQF